jgi:hypothetical protein
VSANNQDTEGRTHVLTQNTHDAASAHTRRSGRPPSPPFAPGAIGFRAMMKVPYNRNPFGGAQVAA